MRDRLARCLPALVALTFPLAAAALEPGLVPHVDRMNCGNTLITAQASCFGTTSVCVRETLTFQRPESRMVVAPHQNLGRYPLADGKKVEALDYHASSWACAEGTNGGRYFLLVMARTSGGKCALCEFLRLYHPNGSLIASTLRFDAAGRPEEDAKASELIGKILRKPGSEAFRRLYGK